MSIIQTVAVVFLFLMIYSFVGWVYESIEMSIQTRKLVNRGFLSGPIIPIYGFGALIVLLILGKETNLNIFQLFLLAGILDCTLEYLTSWAMEKLFHARWWDYSTYFMNINGRVCLIGFCAFGALSVLLLKYIHPFVNGLVMKIPMTWIYIISGVLFLLFIADLVTTVKGIVSFNKKLAEIQAAINKEKEKYTQTLAEFRRQVSERASDIVDNLQKRGIDLEAIRENLTERIEPLLKRFENSEFNTSKIKTLRTQNKFIERRLLRAFPKLRSVEHEEALESVKEAAKHKK